MKRIKLKALLACFLLTINTSFLSGQNDIDLNALPPVAELIVQLSNPPADTIIIGLHGGPTNMLYTGDFDFFENINTFSVVELKQYQHQNPAIMANAGLSLEEAIIANDTTVAMLKKVVNHFNDLDKTVVLIGHSFGAFLLPEYLDDYGIEEIHRIIPMSGRLNMNDEIVDAFATGFWAGFENDGLTTSVDLNQAPSADWAGMKLQAGVGYNRYVDSLGGMDLTKLMYVYGTNDQAVGSLVDEEVTMLQNASATILAIQNGDHDAPFLIPNMNQVLDFIRGGQTVSVHENIVIAPVKMYPTIIESQFLVEAEKNGKLNIINAVGQIILQKNCLAGKTQIVLNDLPAGLYHASFRTEDNEWVNQKIIRR